MIRGTKRFKSQSQSLNKLESLNCVKCNKTVQSDDEVFECVWCEGVQHRTCLQISVDQFSALSDVSSNNLFFVPLA